jgi:hypothetical protein
MSHFCKKSRTPTGTLHQGFRRKEVQVMANHALMCCVCVSVRCVDDLAPQMFAKSRILTMASPTDVCKKSNFDYHRCLQKVEF